MGSARDNGVSKTKVDGAERNRIMKRSICLFWMVSLALLTALPVPLVVAQSPLEKHGACPSGYHTSGNYCAPSSAAALPALPKIGGCPSGYHTSGDYCLASSTRAKPAVIKSGSCPTGYYTSGAYCLKS